MLLLRIVFSLALQFVTLLFQLHTERVCKMQYILTSMFHYI